MQRADSPSTWSLGSQEPVAGVALRPTTANAVQKPAYRLFPSVEPTPPASPKASAVFPKANDAPEPIRRRSSSLDETTRMTIAPHPHGLRQLHTARRQPSKAGIVDLKPMSTVPEQPLDSPTVPSRFTFKSFASTRYSEDSYHGRSSSAPGDFVRENDVSPMSPEQELVPKSLNWTNKRANGPSKTLHGLGLTMQPVQPDDLILTDLSAKRGPKQKPNLRLDLGRAEQPDRPPPPPPKSPRHHVHKTSVHSQNASFHSRTSSAHSRVSSRASSREVSPIAIAQSVACQPVRPIYIHHAPSTKDLPLVTDDPAIGTSERVRDIMGSPIVERGRQIRAVFRKPVPRVPSKESPDQKLHATVLPSSKFSLPSPKEEAIAEGEKTPRAVAPFPIARAQPHPYQNPAASTSSLVVPGTDTEDVPPPTPRKDSFQLQKGSDESAVERPVARRNDSTAKPSHFLVAASARADPGAAKSAENTLQPSPPAREPPKRPVSPPSIAPTLESSHARSRAPTPDLPGRSVTPDPDGPVKAESHSRYDRPTPELPFRAATPDLSSKGQENPGEVLRGLARQTEALHARYTSLRSDRQKLSMSIVSSLRDPKAGPQYSNTLLDQHLSLAAINSSMDICFAKLKSLECRKEEAMNLVIAQQATRRRHDKLRQAATARSHSSLRSPPSGRSTPELTVEVVRTKISATKLRKDSATISADGFADRTVETINATITTTGADGPSSDVSGKRLTAIQSPVEHVAEPDEMSSSEAETAQPKRIRIKGAKAAKLLGLMKDAVEGPGSPGITLPDDGYRALAPMVLTPHGGSPAIEVHIPSSPFKLVLPPPSPAPTSPLPTPPSDARPLVAITPVRKDTTGSLSSLASSDMTSNTIDGLTGPSSRKGSTVDSVAEETEAHTPQEEEQPMGLKSARRGQLQTIQVFVDDDSILDLYQEASRK